MRLYGARGVSNFPACAGCAGETGNMCNVVGDPCIRVRLSGDASEPRRLSLPGVMAAMMRDEVVAFPALRPHQSHAWHMFLAQLGAIALSAAGSPPPPEDEEEWRRLLRCRTTEFPGDDPWRLVVPDPSRPAFLQPAAPDGLAAYRAAIGTPDALDPLVTSKNHDVKAARMRVAEADDWIFALVDLQTMEGFMGAGNYGISRMNGGFSSRPFLGFAPPGGVGAHLRRDIGVLLASRLRIIDDARFPSFRADGGHALLWTVPWDGSGSLSLADLDPLYIEICRRVRLESEDGRITARAAGSRAARVDAREISGLTGDPWAPVVLEKTGPKALSLSHHGFAYHKLAELLFDAERSILPPAASFQAGEDRGRDWRLVARGLARGQGKTEGFHERFLPMSASVRRGLGIPSQRQALGELSNRQLNDIRQVGLALRTAIAVAASGGKPAGEVSADDRRRADPFSRALDRAADATFFAALWQQFEAREAGEEAARAAPRQAFVSALVGAARTLLREAGESVPCPSIRRHRARARAQSYFETRMRREFPFLVRAGSAPPSTTEAIDDEHAPADPVSAG